VVFEKRAARPLAVERPPLAKNFAKVEQYSTSGSNGGESGILNALRYRPRAFNEMPTTEVLTGSYVLSHLEH